MSTETFTYRVDGMTCDHCKRAVSSKVANLGGVDAVDIDLDTKLVTITGDGIEHAAVVAAVDQAGYDAERVV